MNEEKELDYNFQDRIIPLVICDTDNL